jgi:hypothetical protein
VLLCVPFGSGFGNEAALSRLGLNSTRAVSAVVAQEKPFVISFCDELWIDFSTVEGFEQSASG